MGQVLAVVKLTRTAVFLAALFVTVDAGLCPVLCLYTDQAEHGSSNLPSPSASTACGVCACGLVGIDDGFPCPLAPVDKQAAEFLAARPLLDSASDIDHPPRQS